MTSSHPLVSIVIINFNYARYVATAITSALAQTYAMREIVVVDDGSTDGSHEVIASFGGHVRPIFKTNGGQTNAMNTGFAAAAGDIVMFLDADDALAPTAVEEVVAAWRPGVAKVQFCLELISAEGRSRRFVFPYFGPGSSPERIRAQVLRTGLYAWPPTSGNAFARRFLERVMPLSAERFPCMTDGALNTVAPLYGDILSIDKVLGYYRVHDNNMQNAPVAERIRRGVLNKRREAQYLREQAAALGIDMPADLLDQRIHLEGRIASLKLDRARHPVGGDSLRRLVPAAAVRLLQAEERAARRLFHLLWLFAVLVSPRWLCTHLVAFRFIPGTRPDGLSDIMAALGLVRRRWPASPSPPTAAASAGPLRDALKLVRRA